MDAQSHSPQARCPSLRNVEPVKAENSLPSTSAAVNSPVLHTPLQSHRISNDLHYFGLTWKGLSQTRVNAELGGRLIGYIALHHYHKESKVLAISEVFVSSTIELAHRLQRDLECLDAASCRICDPYRTLGQIPDSIDAAFIRAALSLGQPISIPNIPFNAQDGLAAMSLPDIPYYQADRGARAFASGQGYIMRAHSTQSCMPVIIVQLVGQTLHVFCAQTPDTLTEYEGMVAANASVEDLFCWLVNQQSSLWRVTHPGEAIFLPPGSFRASISLGYHGSNFAASAIYFLSKKRQAAEMLSPDDARPAKKKQRT